MTVSKLPTSGRPKKFTIKSHQLKLRQSKTLKIAHRAASHGPVSHYGSAILLPHQATNHTRTNHVNT